MVCSKRSRYYYVPRLTPPPSPPVFVCAIADSQVGMDWSQGNTSSDPYTLRACQKSPVGLMEIRQRAGSLFISNQLSDCEFVTSEGDKSATSTGCTPLVEFAMLPTLTWLETNNVHSGRSNTLNLDPSRIKMYVSNIGYVSFFALKAALSRLMRLFDSGSGFPPSSN